MLYCSIATATEYAYVTNFDGNTVSVINTQTYERSTVGVGNSPYGVAITPDGYHAYVTNSGAGTVSVINTQTYAVDHTVAVGSRPLGVAITQLPLTSNKFIEAIQTYSNIFLQKGLR